MIFKKKLRSLCTKKFSMKSRFPRLSRITLKDWLEFHPYKKEVSSDHFYIDLGNELQHELLHIDDEDYMVGGDYKQLACILACYLEDIVSQTGLLTSFIDEHNKLYGKYLPFYDMAEYDRANVNLADVQFLIWHFYSNLPVPLHFVDPYNIGISELAKYIYNMLNEAVFQAPVNEDLKKALILPPQADFSIIIKHLDFFFFKCYLYHYYTTALLEEEKIDLRNQKCPRENFRYLLVNRRMRLLFNRVSPLLAQSSGEMLAHWAGEEHPQYQKLISLSKLEGGSVQWENKWYAADTDFSTMNNKIEEPEKFLSKLVESQTGIIKREEECFLEVNDNKRIKFLGSKREAFLFIDKVWDEYHFKYGTDTVDRKIFDVHALTFGVDEDLENLVVFFNPRVGMEFYPNIAQCIAQSDNKYFDKNAETNIEDLMLDEKVSSDFIKLLIENKMIEIESITGEKGYNYVWSHCDFLLRYWKKERYKSELTLYI